MLLLSGEREVKSAGNMVVKGEFEENGGRRAERASGCDDM